MTRSSSDTGEPTVDNEVLSAEVAVLRPRHPHDETGNLLRPSQPANWNARRHLLHPRLAEHATRELRVDEARGDAVRQHTVAGDLRCERRGETVEPELARGIRRAAGMADVTEHRGHVHDPAPPTGPHARKHGTAEQQGRAQVHAVYPVEVVGGNVGE